MINVHYENKVQVMVNNSTNIDKTNNQFPSQLIEHNQNITTYPGGIPDTGWGQEHICVGIKSLNGIARHLHGLYCSWSVNCPHSYVLLLFQLI